MSVKLKQLILSIIAATFLSFETNASMAKPKAVDESCDGDDCSATLSGKTYSRFCSSSPHVFAFWNKKNPDYVMLQCPCDCTSESNTNWLVDIVHEKIYAFAAGRFVLKSFIASAPVETEVPDRFGSTKFCNTPDNNKLNQSMFVLLFKKPNTSAVPYCYEIGYISLKKAKILVQTNNGRIAVTNEDYWLAPLSHHEAKSILEIGRAVVQR